MRPPSILTVTALVVGLLPACSRDTKSASPQPADAIAVTVARVAMADVAETFEAGGVVQARTSAVLMARVLAPVREVRVAPGDRVRAGEVLITLDGRDLSAQARHARAAAAAAEQDVVAAAADGEAAGAALALAQATHARIASLHAKRSATSQELDDATGALRAAEARAAGARARALAARSGMERARAGSEAAETTETFSRVLAPFDGVVTEKMVEPGNMAAPGTPLLRVEDTRSFRLDVRIDESRVAEIAPGATVSVSAGVGPAGTETVTTGNVTEIGRAVDADARSFLVKIALPAGEGWRSGMFARARFSTRPRRALTVPRAALVHHGQVASVFVVEKDMARLRLVNVSGTEVLAGLSEGDAVIVTPPPALTDGRRVTVGGR